MSTETLIGTGPGSLSQILDFDHVVRINANGEVTEVPDAPRAPECREPSVRSLIADDGWTLITEGLTGQSGYNGPWMHDSEQIEGGVARRILEHAAEHDGGFYVAVYAVWDCEECGGAGLVGADEVPCPANCEPGDTTIEGWAIAYKPSTEVRVPCPQCHGDGAVYVQARVGQHAIPSGCPTCNGDGDVPAGAEVSA